MKLRKLNKMYSTDGDFIYRYGKKQPEIDAKTFRVIANKESDCALGLDKNFVYKFDGIIEGADPNTFEYIDKCFFKDKESVYYAYHKLDQLNPQTTYILNEMYIRDSDQLYYCDWHGVEPPLLVEPKVNINKIQVRGEWIFDDKNMYFSGIPIAGVNCKSITFFDEYGFFMDDQHVYYQGSRLEYADTATFQPIGNGYSKDDTNVYFFSERIVDADVATFKAKGETWGLGMDMYRSYHYGK